MATFGRFDIHYPDGRVEHAALTGDRISVGRAADNSIVLRSDLIAAHHFELQIDSGVVYVINLDSIHGTRISGVTLLDGQPHRLSDGAEITIGGLRIVYHGSGFQPTVPMASISDSTQIVRVPFSVTLDHSLIEVHPASNASVEIHVSNRLTSAQQIEVSVDGLPEEWTKLSQTSVLLDGGESHTVHLYITPPRRADVPPSEYPVTIAIKSTTESGREFHRPLVVRLREFAGLSVAVDPPKIKAGDSFNMYLLNQGNQALRLGLSAFDKDAALDIGLAQDAIVLNAGQRVKIAGRATGKRPLAGNTRTIPFALLVRAENASRFLVAMPASAVLRPRVSTRVLATFVMLVVVLAAYLAATLTRVPPPAILDVSLSAKQVARGTPVALSWQAEAADRFVIEVDRIAIAELPAHASDYVLTTNQYQDPVQIALIAVQGETNAIETREIIVYQPVTIFSFATNRSELWRNVGARLVIDWQVEGAVALDIAIPDGFEAIFDERSDDGGRMVLYGVPTADFDLTLRTEDELGNNDERRMGIRVLDPECTPIRDAPVFLGPDSRFPQTQIAIEGVPILATGINEDKDWLRMELANGENGWGFRGGFFCERFDPDALTVITDIPQLPTETTTPTSTATATSPAPAGTSSPTATLAPTFTPPPTDS